MLILLNKIKGRYLNYLVKLGKRYFLLDRIIIKMGECRVYVGKKIVKVGVVKC